MMQHKAWFDSQLEKHAMKTIFASLLFLLVACQPERNGPDQSSYRTDPSEFTLAFQQTKRITVSGTEAFDVHFSKLIQESRCPTGATCVQKGTAIIELTLAGKDPKTIEIDHSITYTFNSSDYKITFLKLDPYPDVNKTFDLQQLQAQLRVERL